MYNILFITVLCLTIITGQSTGVLPNDPSVRTATECTDEAIFFSGCAANVCFALDGSGSVSTNDFSASKAFVQSVTNALGLFPETEYAANHFGRIAYLISFLTKNRLAFNVKMENVAFIGDSATSVGAGIVMCDALLASRVGEPNKIVVITDGRNNFGGDPIGNAALFRNRDPNGRISAIGIGNTDESTLAAIAGDTGHVLTVSNYIDLFKIINDLVCQVCDIV